VRLQSFASKKSELSDILNTVYTRKNLQNESLLSNTTENVDESMGKCSNCREKGEQDSLRT
jgi:hypothetical protein